MSRIKFKIFLITLFLLVLTSSAWSVDFNCPGGRWVQTGNQSYPLCSAANSCLSFLWLYSDTCTTISGTQKVAKQYMYNYDWKSNCSNTPPDEYPYCWGGSAPSWWHSCVQNIQTYEWKCPEQCVDNDGDGYQAYNSQNCPQGNDCNDNNSAINPATAEICGDGIDNNCNGQVDEGCGKFLQYYSGSGQEGFICETLKEPFTVKAAKSSGEPETGIGIGWQITNQPTGASASVTPTSGATGSDGLASSTLKLGSLPGDYTVNATCGQCTSGSQQTFTATAKCPPVPQYYQDDYDDPYDNWCKYTYYDAVTKKTVTRNTTCQYDNGSLRSGYTQYTIADKGCALTSMAMVMDRYGYGDSASPSDWNDFFTQIGGYTEDGLVQWDTIPAINSQIGGLNKQSKVDAPGNYIPLSNSIMDDYLKKCMPVIVKVKNWYKKKDGTLAWSWHWVVVTGSLYAINDPGYKDRTNLSYYKNEIYAMQVYQYNNGGCQ